MEVCTGRTFQARPEVKINISGESRPVKEIEISTEAGPARNKIQILARAQPGHFLFPISARIAKVSDF